MYQSEINYYFKYNSRKLLEELFYFFIAIFAKNPSI